VDEEGENIEVIDDPGLVVLVLPGGGRGRRLMRLRTVPRVGGWWGRGLQGLVSSQYRVKTITGLERRGVMK
jgi:hypothetical protein